MQQQAARQSQMMQQQRMRQQQQMAQQQRMRQQQAQIRRQQEQARRQQAQIRRQMQERQRRAQAQRAKATERRRIAQQRRQMRAKKPAEGGGATQQRLAVQQRAMQRQASLQGQRTRTLRQQRLRRLRKSRTTAQGRNERPVYLAALLVSRSVARRMALPKPRTAASRTKSRATAARTRLRAVQSRSNTVAQLARRVGGGKARKAGRSKVPKKYARAFASCTKRGCGKKQCSFHGDTLVVTRNGTTPIRSLVVDEDDVWSRDEWTGETGWKPVTALYSNDYDDTVAITIQQAESDALQTLRSNRIHPFFVIRHHGTPHRARAPPERVPHFVPGSWVAAADLKPGDHLLTRTGNRVIVATVTITASPLQAYNISVADFHTFFVAGSDEAASAAVWVHNDCEYVDSRKIRFSQTTISQHFRDTKYGTIYSLARRLKTGKMKARDIKPIRVVEVKGSLISLDNRRLRAHQMAGRRIRIQRVDPKDPDIAKVLTKRGHVIFGGKQVVTLTSSKKYRGLVNTTLRNSKLVEKQTYH